MIVIRGRSQLRHTATADGQSIEQCEQGGSVIRLHVGLFERLTVGWG